MIRIDRPRLSHVKPAFATRRVNHADIALLDEAASGLLPGDLVLARVDAVGHHTKIELPDGRRATLFPGDEVMLACGARYAPDQFEADSPDEVGPANLAAAGGIAGIVQLSHDRMKPATEITVIGALCTRSGVRMNLADYSVRTPARDVALPVIAVCGTSMNSGKTHTAASLVRGFSQTGRRVAAIKATGTGAGGDLWLFRDSGAAYVADFTDAGFATTYRAPVEDIAAGVRRLVAEAQDTGADMVVMEVADGLRQEETAQIMRSAEFRAMLSGVVFAAGDAMGAEAGVAWLNRAGLNVRAVSGVMTRSPLAIREFQSVSELPCLTSAELCDPAMLARIAGMGLAPVGLSTAA
jgi:molybdopterin-guanine dinucleotide biosynthesis protein